MPFSGVPNRPFTEIFDEAFTEKGHFFYQAWFQKVGPPEAEARGRRARLPAQVLLRHLRRRAGRDLAAEGASSATLLEGMVDPQVIPRLADAEETSTTTSPSSSASGFFGPISRYRNHERDFAWLQQFKGRKLEQPTLLIGGDRDPAFNGFGRIPDPAAMMRRPRDRPARRPRAARLRPLDPAGAAGGGERHPDPVAEGAVIRLYHCADARSFRPLWALEELGLDYELTVMPFPPRYRAKDYMAINPLGTIPALIDGGTFMTESAAIVQYLVTRYGPSALAVEVDDPAYGAWLNWLHFGEATLTFPQTLVLRYRRFEPGKAEVVADDYAKWFLARLRAVDRALQGAD